VNLSMLSRPGSKAHPIYQKSARNLAHYIALRHRDIRPLQAELAGLGLSSLGRAEAHVMATLDAMLAAAHKLSGRSWRRLPRTLDFQEGNELLRTHAETLLGPSPKDRAVRIMVTMPSEAASDYELVRDLLAPTRKAVWALRCNSMPSPLCSRSAICSPRCAVLPRAS
jgi:pyruvate kinase